MAKFKIFTDSCSDLSTETRKKYDIEYWSPVDQTYREITSCSNCTDFQARSVNCRVRRKDGSIEFVHTLNGTAISLARTMVAVMENYANEDGTFTVPKALKPYLGKDVL